MIGMNQKFFVVALHSYLNCLSPLTAI